MAAQPLGVGVRYNIFHDQLLLSAGSDSRLVFSSMASMPSEPMGPWWVRRRLHRTLRWRAVGWGDPSVG